MAWRIEYNKIVRDLVEVSPGNQIHVNAALGSDGNDGSKGSQFKTLPTAYALAITGRNDVIILESSVSALNLSADPAFSKNLVHIIGYPPGGFENQRARIGMASDYASPIITVSGYGNHFENIYTMHGFSNTKVALQGWLVSGARNVFRRVHFGGPMNAVLSADAANREVLVTGQENYFDHCVFGVDTIDRTGANSLVSLGPDTDTTFEDCLFLCRISGTTPYFFEVLNTSGVTRAFFKRCQFVALSVNMAVTMGVAFNFTGGDTCAMVFDSGCEFIGVSELAASASLKYIWTPRQFPASADELNLISLNTAVYP